MSDGYDRNDNNGGSTFMMGLLTGAVIGAGIGLLFTTKAGEDLRNQISDQASKISDQASSMATNVADQASKGLKKVTATASDIADRGRDVYGKAKDAAIKGADEAQAYVRDNSNAAATAVESATRRI